MEPIYAPHFGEVTRKRKMIKSMKRDKKINEFLDFALKLIMVVTTFNVIHFIWK